MKGKLVVIGEGNITRPLTPPEIAEHEKWREDRNKLMSQTEEGRRYLVRERLPYILARHGETAARRQAESVGIDLQIGPGGLTTFDRSAE